MSNLFITAIDTGAGKTVVTGLIARYLLQQGQDVITAKICQTGCVEESEDIVLHRKIMGIPLQPEDKSGLTCHYIFSYPASPHLAARLDGAEIDPSSIQVSLSQLIRTHENVIIEGVGGLKVPLREKYTTFDFIRQNNYEVVVVATPILGSINHILLTVDALLEATIRVRGIVYNHMVDSGPEITRDTLEVIRKFYPSLPVVEVPGVEGETWPEVDFGVIF